MIERLFDYHRQMAQTTTLSLRDELNHAQAAAVSHEQGPLLVVAGAGSGKTKTLACRVAHLIERGIPPERILLLTFTRRAAREMLDRAGRISNSQAAGRVWGGTFHAVANRLLRMRAPALKLPIDFTVIDQADAADMMGLIRGDLELGQSVRRFPKKDTVAAIYSRMVNAEEKLSEVLERDFPWCREDGDGIRSIFRAYTQRKREHNILDYDDLLLFWRLLATSPGVGDVVANMFDHILVDEYQDTNALQADILLGMRRHNDNLMVVGDDAQAIYSFRSATVRSMLDFPKHWPNATVVRLEQNYRSTQPILNASNAVMAAARERFTKNLWTDRRGDHKPLLITCLDENGQCDAVCREVLDQREAGTPLKNQAVLFRAGWHSDLLEIELSRRNIPYVKYGGVKFLEAAHIKDVLAVLRILDNPLDEIGWWRTLQLVEGIGPATARRVMSDLGVAPQGPPEDAPTPLRRLFADPPAVPGASHREFEQLRNVLADCAIRAPDGAQAPVSSQIERIRSFCEDVFLRKYGEASSRLRDIEQLEHIASGYSSRGGFVADLILDPPQSTEDFAGPPLLDDDYLILSTIHSAKGCEWDVVHILHVADGMIPSDMALKDDEGIEEERRLLYVAMTRAKDLLYLYFPMRHYHRSRGLGDAHSYAQLSRFLTEPVRALCEQKTHGIAETGDAVSTSAEPVGPIDAILEDLLEG